VQTKKVYRPITPKNVTAVILAGGKGRRLGGQDKGLVSYQGKLLIEHVIARIQPQLNHILINANRNQSVYSSYGYPITVDELSDFQGPLAGFATAMKLVKTSHILTLPCDGPALPDDLLDRMLKKQNDPSKSILVAHDGKRLQTVYALIPVALLSSLERYLETGQRRIDQWYAEHDFITVDFSDKPDAFKNINTQEQLLT